MKTKMLNCRTKWQELDEIVGKPMIIDVAEFNTETQSWDLAYHLIEESI